MHFEQFQTGPKWAVEFVYESIFYRLEYSKNSTYILVYL